MTRRADVLVVGSGVAGCAAALGAAREGADVLVATKATSPDETATWHAQGGVATTRGDPESLKRDIVAASGGTADEDALDVLVSEAGDAVRDVLVETLDVDFDGDAGSDGDADSGDGTADDFDYAREAAHSEERILHVNAETGRHVLAPFLNHLADHERVTFLEDTAALELVTHEGRVHGALLDPESDRGSGGGAEGEDSDVAGDSDVAAVDGDPDVAGVEPVFAGATVLATGGVGACYGRSTNPAGATGDGIAMAALAGADVADLEYVQFHPTALDASAVGGGGDVGSGDGPDATDDPASESDTVLLSEAVRGAGAVLRDAEGERFMPDYHPDADLAPRDVVARAVAQQREATGAVRLDVSSLDPPFAEQFPALADRCAEWGVDPVDGIPVAPAQHFLCGGVAVDDRGRTTLDRLYAVGECARTGVHGANRLASTSLLEGLVWGRRAGADAAGQDVVESEPPDLLARDPDLPPRFAAEKFRRLRRVMDDRVGLVRTPDGLQRATSVLRRLKGEVDAYVRTRTSRSLYELRNAAVTSLLIARAAAENPESAGCHHVVTGGDEADDTGSLAAEEDHARADH